MSALGFVRIAFPAPHLNFWERHEPLLPLLIATAATAAIVLGVPGIAHAAAPTGRYVALGDSYTSGLLPATAHITRDMLGWQPTGPGLVVDLKHGHYFA